MLRHVGFTLTRAQSREINAPTDRVAATDRDAIGLFLTLRCEAIRACIFGVGAGWFARLRISPEIN